MMATPEIVNSRWGVRAIEAVVTYYSYVYADFRGGDWILQRDQRSNYFVCGKFTHPELYNVCDSYL